MGLRCQHGEMIARSAAPGDKPTSRVAVRGRKASKPICIKPSSSGIGKCVINSLLFQGNLILKFLKTADGSYDGHHYNDRLLERRKEHGVKVGGDGM